MERAAIAERTRSDATRRAYASGWADFSRWCVEAGRGSLPASADTVGLYAVSLARRGLTVATVEQRVTAVSQHHLSAGLASPVGPEIRELMGGLRRKLGTAPTRQKMAVSVADLRAMLAALPDDARGARDRALLLVGFASGLRRSELAALDAGDVDQVAEGLVLRIGRSKTDQDGAGRELGVHRGRRAATCPARALAGWLVERGAWPGALFCRVSTAGAVLRARLSPQAVGAVVQAAARAAGLDASRYGGHSLRAGCATAAAELGASDGAIMGRTGHRSVGMVRRYVRHGTLFAVDPLRGAL